MISMMDAIIAIVSGAPLFLILNAVWDFGCALSIFFSIPPMNTLHADLWKDENDTANPAARHLMAYLILIWGGMRLAAGVGWPVEWACVSYLIEGVVFGGEVICGRMHWQGVWVSLSSLLLAVCFYY